MKFLKPEIAVDIAIKKELLQFKKELISLKKNLLLFCARLRGSTWVKASLKYLLLYLLSAFYTFILLQVTVSYGEILGFVLLLFGVLLLAVYLAAAGIIEFSDEISAKIVRIKDLLLTRLGKTIKLFLRHIPYYDSDSQ